MVAAVRVALYTGLYALAAALALSPVFAQTTGSVLQGVVRDTASGESIADAVIEVVGNGFTSSVRSDERGTFRMGGVPEGALAVRVRRLGYLERRLQIAMPRRDSSIVVVLGRNAQIMPSQLVRARLTGVEGVVGNQALKPIGNAVVQVLGSNRQTTTDSNGAFFIVLNKPGSYMLRISRAGYSEVLSVVSVSNHRVVDASRLLDSSSKALPTGREGLWQDFDQRLRWRSHNAALVPGSELRLAGAALTDALTASPTVVLRGLVIGASTCVFINGVPRPGWPLNAFAVEEIEAVELYGPAGDATGSLMKAWPPNSECPTRPGATSTATRGNVARFAVIWTKR